MMFETVRSETLSVPSFKISPRTRRFCAVPGISRIPGSSEPRDFVKYAYTRVKEKYHVKREKTPKPISGLEGIYSLKRLME